MKKEIYKVIGIIFILFLALIIINNLKYDKINGNSIFDDIKSLFNPAVGKEIVNEEVREESLDNKNNFDFSGVNINEIKEQTKDAQEESFTGSLAVIQTDDFENPENSKLYYFLQSKDKNYRLISQNNFQGLTSGTEIEVKGKIFENAFFKIYLFTLFLIFK